MALDEFRSICPKVLHMAYPWIITFSAKNSLEGPSTATGIRLAQEWLQIQWLGSILARKSLLL